MKVLAVDDSAVVREALRRILGRDQLFQLTVASDPLIAEQRIGQDRPDVILLDLEMPRMDGLTFLRRIMARDPIPVVVCSALAEDGSEAALRALEEGAVEVIAKPRSNVNGFFDESEVLITDAIRAAASARLRLNSSRGPSISSRPSPLKTTSDRVVAVGASTGGTEALRVLLEAMPPDCPGIVVVQHMPETYTAAFARRLNQLCAIEVKEAQSRDRVSPGRALVAPGNRHTRVIRDGAHYSVEVFDGPLVSRHRPSVDVLFQSVARAAGSNAIGVIMTGMGQDGADGLLAMRRAGAFTVAQDEDSCVVFGMPKEAIQRGGAGQVVPLQRIAQVVLQNSQPAVRR